MSANKPIREQKEEISKKLISNSIIENIENNIEVDIDYERLLLQNLLDKNNITTEATNKLGNRIKLESTQIIDNELEARIQEIERNLLRGYEEEEAKEKTVTEEKASDYEGDLDEDYYYSGLCHESGQSPILVARNEISYEDCGGNSENPLNKGHRLMSPAENHKVVCSSSDELMKYNAFHTPFGLIQRCNPKTCPYHGNCINKMTMDDIMEIKINFWGPMDEEAPSRGTRRLAILKLLQNAIHRQSKTFQFTFGGRDHNNSLVCEAAFLIALGLSNNPNASQAPSQWLNVKKWVLEGYDLEEGKKYSYNKITAKKDSQQFDRESKRIKFDNACAYIQYFAEEFGDRVSSADNGNPDTLVVPFCTIAAFYDEYKLFSLCHQTPVECYAGQTVFTEAYEYLYKYANIRKLKAKGTFNTCEICNNADTLLKNKYKKLTPSQRDIIQRFRQLHLKQQSDERRFLDVKKLKASQMDGNRPRAALIFPDFMTEYTCQTPKWPASSSSDMKVDSRLLGIEVYCGPIKTVFIYRVDALVVGGADIMVECVRQAIIDLVKLLNKEGLMIPKALWLQFDNCGENKNKEMFAYASILVEDLYFDEVEICFLIVGHTHASIDQYFSMISHKIHSKSTVFIGSPLALLELVRQCHYNKYVQDPVIRDITVYYDIAKAFKPYINKSIRFYQIPHYFIIQRVFGRVSAMQSKMLGSATNRILLPMRPEKSVIDKDAMLSLLCNDVPLPTSFAMMDGLDAVKFHLLSPEKSYISASNTNDNNIIRNYPLLNCNGQTEIGQIDQTINEAFGNVEKSKNLLAVNRLLPDLEAICGKNAVYQQECRMFDESEGKIPKRSYEYREELLKKIRNVSNSDRGFICWLNINSKREELTPWVDIIKPEPFSPQSVLDQFSEIKTIVDSEEKDGVDAERDNDEEPSMLPLLLSESRLSHRNSVTIHRNTTSNVKNKTIPLEKRSKRLYMAAQTIAKTASWVIKQCDVKIGKITVTATDSFDKNTFLKIPGLITKSEYEWYFARETVEKVLNVALKEFQNAEPWEPFPTSSLSNEDNQQLQLEKDKQDKLDAQAVQLGESLLQRFTDRAKETDQIIKYGPNNNESFIKEIGRHFKKASDFKYYKCDIKTCEIVTTDDTCCRTCKTTVTYRYCKDHISHSNHEGVGKRKKREQVTKSEYEKQEKISTHKNDITTCNNNITTSNNNNNNNDNNINEKKIDNNNDVIKINHNDKNNTTTNNSNNNKFKTSNNSIISSNTDKNATKTNNNNNKIKNNNDNSSRIKQIDDNNNKNSKRKYVSSSDNTSAEIIDHKKPRNWLQSIVSNDNNNNNNSLFSFIYNIINTDDKDIQDSVIIAVHKQLFKDGLLFKDEKDSRYKVFVKIRKAVISGKKSEILTRIENLFMDWPNIVDDLKYLSINIFQLSIILNFDWKTPDILKNTLKRKEFVRAFSKAFVEMYCSK